MQGFPSHARRSIALSASLAATTVVGLGVADAAMGAAVTYKVTSSNDRQTLTINGSTPSEGISWAVIPDSSKQLFIQVENNTFAQKTTRLSDGTACSVDGILHCTTRTGFDDLIVNGNAGNDGMDFSAGDLPGMRQKLSGHAGNDVLTSGDGDDLVYGAAGSDTLASGSGGDVIDGGNDPDQLYGEAGHDLLRGGAGQDLLDGSSGDDELLAGSGLADLTPNLLYGGAGNDQLIGAPGNDYLEGESGFDDLRAGGGSDYLNGVDGEQDSLLDCGAGTNDLVDFDFNFDGTPPATCEVQNPF